MKLLWAGTIAIIAALLTDRIWRKLSIPKQWRLIFLIPLTEEIIKITVASVFQLAPIIVYSIFGFGEGIYETFQLKKRFEVLLVIVGTLTHFGFGIFFLLPIAWEISFFIAIGMHMGWNYYVVAKND